MKFRWLLVIPFVVAALCACGPQSEEPEPKGEKKITEETQFANSLATIPAKPGVVGLFTVPEMLCLSVMDSTRADKAAEAVQRSYGILDEELQRVRAVRNGPYGQISYSNDTANFKYECFVLISKVPSISPRRGKIVVLETTRMLAFNYYGPYQLLYVAYAELKTYMAEHKLEQAGPLREYYLTDPRTEPDVRKWRTALLVPVRKQ